MRAMAIGALHQALGDPVVVGHGELVLYRAVAREAKFRLRFFQQAFVEPASFFHERRRLNKSRLRQRGFRCLSHSFAEHEVWGMAFVASNCLQLVFGTVEEIMFLAGLMTRKAVMLNSPWPNHRSEK